MDIPLSTFEWALGGLLFALVCLVAWVWSKLVDSVGTLSRSVGKLTADLAAHQLDTERRFAKEIEVTDKFGKIDNNLGSIQKDIQGINISLAPLAAISQMTKTNPQP